MKRIIIIVFFLFFAYGVLYAQKTDVGGAVLHAVKGYSCTEFTIDSEYFPGEERTVRIALPDNYATSDKYPVIYVLDGYFLFDTAADYVMRLTKGAPEGYDNIPQSIVVGVFHNDRHYETNPNFEGNDYYEGPAKLKKFLEYELIPYIDGKYSTSGYNVVIGHSNTAHFVMRLMTQNTNPFDGIIALSLSMKENECSDRLVDRMSERAKEVIFVGYGTRDDDFKEFAEKMLKNKCIVNDNLRISEFNASHLELPAIALVAGLRFMFDEYKNFGDFTGKSLEPDFSIATYKDGYVNKIKELYGIDTDLTEDDYFHFIIDCVKSKNRDAFYGIVKYAEDNEIIELDYHTSFYLTRDLGDWDAAKQNAYNMSSSYDENDKKVLYANIKAYIDFFVTDLKTPFEAIAFLETAVEASPEYKLEYSYFIAKTGIENGMEPDKVKTSLEYCMRNFRDNRHFSRSDLKALISKI